MSTRDASYEIYIINADGSGQFNLNKSKENETRPAWSPDGNRLVFNSDSLGHPEIFLMNSDRSLVQLTKGFADNFAPHW